MTRPDPSRPSRWYWALIVGGTLISFAPLVGVILSSAFAESLGCPLNEGGVNPCPWRGMDLGGVLNTLFVAGWLMLLTFPGMIGFPVMGLQTWLRARAARRGGSQAQRAS